MKVKNKGKTRRLQRSQPRRVKVVIEHAADGYVAYPVGMKGVVVGQGDSYEQALADVTSAIGAHLREFGADSAVAETAAVEVFTAEAEVAL